MTSPIRRSFRILLLAFAILFALHRSPGLAQTTPRALLTPPDTGQFPTIATYLDVRDVQGNFITGLDAGQVTVLENAQRIAVSELQQHQPGAQFVVVVNPGYTLAIRNSQGVSRYDQVLNALQEWIDSNADRPPDDLSLLIANGPEIIHRADTVDWMASLEANQADIRRSEPSLNELGRAIDLAADPAPRPGMGRAVLLITPPLDLQFSTGIQTLTIRASQQGVRVFVWMISAVEMFDTHEASLLRNLANETGGSYFAYSSGEQFPNIDEYLQPLREVYSVSYQSSITTGGIHELSIEVVVGDDTIASAPMNFGLEISPPNPFLVSPPNLIKRVVKDASQIENIVLTPSQQTFHILVEFPDGYSRPIMSSFLWVDGTIVDQNTEPPFEQFQWDLGSYMADGEHTIQVQVVDALGLNGFSVDTPVQILVDIPKPSPWAYVARQRYVVAGMFVSLAGAVLLLVLLLGGRIGPGRTHRLAKAQVPSRQLNVRTRPVKASSDPLTQPVRGAEPRQEMKETKDESSRRLPHWINRFQWHQKTTHDKPLAYLTRLQNDDTTFVTVPLPIHTPELTLGRDPYKASLVVDDPSIEGMHARLRREKDTFRLSDEGSIAGTWVNYTPVSREGTLLEHGDLIHIGRAGYRFTLHEPKQLRKPVVTRKDPLP